MPDICADLAIVKTVKRKNEDFGSFSLLLFTKTQDNRADQSAEKEIPRKLANPSSCVAGCGKLPAGCGKPRQSCEESVEFVGKSQEKVKNCKEIKFCPIYKLCCWHVLLIATSHRLPTCD